MKTRSYSIFLMASASTSDVANASEPWMASSTTWTPESAPICSALRTASAASSGPTVTTVTSPSPASMTCSACSTAYSSSSDSSPSTFSRSTVLSALNVRSAVASGTYFTATTILVTRTLL